MATTLIDPADVAALVSAEATDPLVRAACVRASGRFISAIGYDPTYRTDDFYLTARRYGTLFSPVAPLHEVLVLEDRVTGEALDYAYFDVDSGTIAPKPRTPWPPQWKTIHLQAVVGFQIMPAAIQDAVVEQAIALFAAPDTTIQQLSQGSRSVSYSSRGALGVTQRWTDAVEMYRRIVAD